MNSIDGINTVPVYEKNFGNDSETTALRSQ